MEAPGGPLETFQDVLIISVWTPPFPEDSQVSFQDHWNWNLESCQGSLNVVMSQQSEQEVENTQNCQFNVEQGSNILTT